MDPVSLFVLPVLQSHRCDNHGDCCGGAASKNALCKTMTPTLNKARTGSCSVGASQAAASVTRGFRPVTCWCDSYCTNNNDCCPLCTQPRCNKQSGSTSDDNRSSDAAAVAAIEEVRDSSSSSIEDVGSSLRARVAAEAAALARESGHLSDCPVHHRVQEMKAAIAATVGPAAGGYEVSSERIMQEVGFKSSYTHVTTCTVTITICTSIACMIMIVCSRWI